MRTPTVAAHLVIAIVLPIVFLSCSDPAPTTDVQTVELISVCDLLLEPTRFDGQRVRVRTALEYGEHHIRLYDNACRDTLLFVGRYAQGLDIWGCNSAHPVEKYGCPLNSDLGVRVTLDGTFHKAKSDSDLAASLLDVQSMTDISINPVAAHDDTHGT